MPLDGVTVAVRVTAWPTVYGVGEADSDSTVVLGTWLIEILTPFEVLAPFLESPPEEAVKEWLPAEREDLVKVAVPPLRVTVPSAFEPSWKVTIPVTEEGLNVAVRVGDCPKVDDVGVTERMVVVVETPTDSVTEFDVLAA